MTTILVNDDDDDDQKFIEYSRVGNSPSFSIAYVMGTRRNWLPAPELPLNNLVTESLTFMFALTLALRRMNGLHSNKLRQAQHYHTHNGTV